MLDFLLWFGMLLMVPGTSLILDPFPPVSVATGPPGNALMTFHFLNCVSSCRERKASYKWSSPTWMALLCIWLLCGFSQGRGPNLRPPASCRSTWFVAFASLSSYPDSAGTGA